MNPPERKPPIGLRGPEAFRVVNGMDRMGFDLSVATTYDDAVTAGYRLNGPLDSVWAKYQRTVKVLGSSEEIRRLEYAVVNTHSKDDYWAALDSELNPIRYLQLLALYPAAGLCLSLNEWFPVRNPETGDILLSHYINHNAFVGYPPLPWNIPQERYDGVYKVKEEVQKFVPVVDYVNNYEVTMPMWEAFVESDRRRYADYVVRFGEVVKRWYLERAYSMLDMANMQDQRDLEEAYSAILNREGRSIADHINAPQRITVLRNDGTPYRTVYSGVPADGQHGPVIDYGGEMKTCREALLLEWLDAYRILWQSMPTLEGQLIAVSDPDHALLEREGSRDPTSNPYMVYDFDAAAASGLPTWRNMAVNSSSGWSGKETTLVVDPAVSGGAQAAHYAAIPALREYYYRRPVQGGGSISVSDIVGEGARKKGNAIPWILGGAAAGYALLQVM